MRRALKAGDLVEVRSASEILATLDTDGELEALAFMPEMIPYLGRRFVVDKRASKICDTVTYTGSRLMKDAVLLGDLRCDGVGHGGCQAECRFFWKEAWLRPVDPREPPPSAAPADVDAVRALADRVGARTSYVVQEDGAASRRYRCQATEIPRCTVRLGTFDPRPYVKEFTSGNVGLGTFVKVTARAAIEEPMRKLGLVPEIPVKGSPGSKPKDSEPLGLQPGDWVQVKARSEIELTLTDKGRNKGLWFDREMLPYCGGTYRVRQRVSRFIDERVGKLVELKNDCVTLEGVVCSGERSLRRWFCPRLIYPYWRESWLTKVDAP